jgi:transcription initiation factor TFIIIB Brf1 subunit/transcription initiation factor TFIIB
VWRWLRTFTSQVRSKDFVATVVLTGRRLHWQLTRSQLEHNHQGDLSILQPKQYQHVRIYLYHRNIHRKVFDSSGTEIRSETTVSTAGCCDCLCLPFPILFKVLLLISSTNRRACIRETNPYLVVATCIYIACKMEECPNHIRTVVNEARSEWAGTSLPNELTKRTHLIRYHQTRRMRILRH